MKKILFSVLPVAAIALLTFKPVNDPLPIGSTLPKPEVKMKDIAGSEVSFKDAKRENGLLVIFSCNTCPIVQGYQERLNDLAKYAMNKKFGVILLNPNEAYRTKGDSYDDMKSYAGKNKFDWYYVVDKNSAMADIFGANRTPEVFLFDKGDKLVYHGAPDDNPGDAGGVTRQHLKLAIDEVSTGKAVTQKESKSVGCTIKRAA
jgi:hypothetical protein